MAFGAVLSVTDHCIEDGAELSCAGCDGEFSGFSGCCEAGSEGFDRGVAA